MNIVDLEGWLCVLIASVPDFCILFTNNVVMIKRMLVLEEPILVKVVLQNKISQEYTTIIAEEISNNTLL